MTLRLPMLLITLAAMACGGADAPAAEDAAPIPVRVVTPGSRTAEPDILLTGILGAKEEIPLGFKVGGVVASVRADAGDRVSEGQLLAALSLTEIDASVAAARESRDKSRRELTRVEALFKDSVATQSQLEDARTGLEVAEAQLRAAEFNRQYAEVRAPAAGVILRRQVENGQLVGAGTPVFVLRVERQGLVLRAGAADREAVRLREGMAAEVSFDAHPGTSFAGRVERVGVAASPMTGTYEVEVAVTPGNRRLASGLIGRARLTPQGSVAVLTLPAEALLEVDGRDATVFVVAEGAANAERRRVRVLWLDGALAAVEGDIDASTRVVTAGATRLVQGTRVRVVAEGTP
ncbi:MAG: efflux RND transporter periplasmic adaptor subunit [Gemmatimonadaceae bacterium]|nr:efflux RND transporter periplasmic adaptor subunit [Gemmatimonadaceae bacterium]MCW5825803.1 efflux RND transporter periplasmic adaptor subunit [Gemmatimonadaceae bacterium]